MSTASGESSNPLAEKAADDTESLPSKYDTAGSEVDSSEPARPASESEPSSNVVTNDGDAEEDAGADADEHEDGDLSDGSSDAGSSAGSQVPETEREEGDGQEEGDKKAKKLDHDEDRRDPQYIPKRGVFYEHDDRTLDEDPEEKKEPPREPRKSKAEHVERWGHDMYDENDQSPKTAEELIDAYGYDIRKEEAPPKARRRRRYGKGPNKYERSWEDEQAYNKTPTRGGYRGGQKRTPRKFENREEDFPSLPGSEQPSRKEAENTPRPQPRDSEHKPSPREEKDLTRDDIKSIFDEIDSLQNRKPIETVTFHNRSFLKALTPPPQARNPYSAYSQDGESFKLDFVDIDEIVDKERSVSKPDSVKMWVLSQDPSEEPSYDWTTTEIKLIYDGIDNKENRESGIEKSTSWRCRPTYHNSDVPSSYRKINENSSSNNLRIANENSSGVNQPYKKRSEPPEGFRGTPGMRGRGGSRRGRPGPDSVQPFTRSQAHGPNHQMDKHANVGSTADEDIATLAQHFSNAVINVDKNIAPIRSQSEPPAEERPRNASHQQHRQEGHHKHQDKHPPQQDKQVAPEQPSTKSKRYSTQRQRPPTGGQAPPTSAPPPTAQQLPNAPNYLPPQQGFYPPPPPHGICPPEGPAPHIAAPPAQFQPGGMQMVTFLPTVPPPPANTFQPPPNIYVPPTPYIAPPPPIVQPGPAEVYQGGVTYYNTQSQQVTRAVPSRRVKLAIPIVAPDSSQPIQ